MTLSILINHFKEPPELIGRLLSSIQKQVFDKSSFDFEVAICSDGYENILSDEFLSSFTFPITYYRREHKGICATRNYLMDRSNGDYLMFCDADDMFHQENGLQTLSKWIEKTTADVIGSCYLVELVNDEGTRLQPVKRDIRHLHGMIFKRSYLIENNIRFPDELETSGDMYFIWLAFHLTGNYAWIPDCFYTWKWNPNSVTRSEMYYSVKIYARMVKCYTLLTENVVKRGSQKLIDKLTASCLITFYVDEQSGRFKNVPEEYALRAKEAVQKYAKRYADIYFSIPEDYAKQIFCMILQNKRIAQSSIFFDDLKDWLRSVN